MRSYLLHRLVLTLIDSEDKTGFGKGAAHLSEFAVKVLFMLI